MVGDSIGIATGDFHLMYIEEENQPAKNKKKRELPMISVFRTFTLCLRMDTSMEAVAAHKNGEEGEYSVESVESLSSYTRSST